MYTTHIHQAGGGGKSRFCFLVKGPIEMAFLIPPYIILNPHPPPPKPIGHGVA